MHRVDATRQRNNRRHITILSGSATQLALDIEKTVKEKVDAQSVLQAGQLGRECIEKNLHDDAVRLRPRYVDKLSNFTEGFLITAKPAFENNKYAVRALFALVSVFFFGDTVTDWVSASLLNFVQTSGSTHGQYLFAVLALHKSLELFFIFWGVYGTWHSDMLYSLFQVKGIVDATRVITNEPQTQEARLNPSNVLIVGMVNDMCIESYPQVSACAGH